MEASGICVPEVRKSADIIASECAGYDGFIFSPGAGVPAEYPAMFRLLEQYSAQKRFLGICLGHQAIAEYFGAELINLPEVYHGIKREINIVSPADYIYNGIPLSFTAGLYHSWAVSPEGLPDELCITAFSIDGVIMSLRHTEYDIRGVQYHPESYMTGFGKQILLNWLGA